jgi:hypothetical protein
MKFGTGTSRWLAWRRTTRKWTAEGFVRVHENGDPLWRFHRGDWIGRRIEEARVSPNGIELWIKVSK